MRQDVAGGKMNGFVKAFQSQFTPCTSPDDPSCSLGGTLASGGDVMSYHTQSDIPNYWTYAKNFVLQDHMFEPSVSWSLPAHLFEVSGWSATCKRHNVPSSCTNAPDPRSLVQAEATNACLRLDRPDLSPTQARGFMRYYMVSGTEPDCEDDQAVTACPSSNNPGLPASGTRYRVSTQFVPIINSGISNQSVTTTRVPKRAHFRPSRGLSRPVM